MRSVVLADNRCSAGAVVHRPFVGRFAPYVRMLDLRKRQGHRNGHHLRLGPPRASRFGCGNLRQLDRAVVRVAAGIEQIGERINLSGEGHNAGLRVIGMPFVCQNDRCELFLRHQRGQVKGVDAVLQLSVRVRNRLCRKRQLGQRLVLVEVQVRQMVAAAIDLCQRRIFAEVQCGQLVVVAEQVRKRGIAADVQRGQLIAAAPEHCQIGIVADIEHSQLIIDAIETFQFCIIADVQRGQSVAVTGESLKFRQAADVQRGQLIVVAVECGQLRIVADVQRGQLIFGAIEIFQFRIIADNQCSQSVSAAVQSIKRRILAHIQRSQLVNGTIECCKRRILAHLQHGQSVVGTCKNCQRGKVFNANERSNLFFRTNDLCNGLCLFFGHIIPVGRVAADRQVRKNPAAEVLVRESRCVDVQIMNDRFRLVVRAVPCGIHQRIVVVFDINLRLLCFRTCIIHICQRIAV